MPLQAKTYKWGKVFYRELALALSLVLLPHLLLVHTFFSRDTATIYLFGLEFSHFYKSNLVLVWFILKSAIVFTILLLWFFHCRFWWRNFLLAASFPFSYWFARSCIISVFQERGGTMVYFWPGLLGLAMIFLVYGIDQIRQKHAAKRFNYFFFKRQHVFYNKDLDRYYGQLSASMETLKMKKVGLNDKTYLYQLYHKKRHVGRQLFLREPDSIEKYKSKLDYGICAFLLCLPFLAFQYIILPNDVKEYQLANWLIKSYGFPSLRSLGWYFSHTFSSLLVCFIWYISERRWWRYALLSPIVLEAYRLWEVFFNSKATKVDEVEYISAAPWILLVVALLYAVSRLIRVKYRILDVYEDLETEMEAVLNQMSASESLKGSSQTSKNSESDSL